MSELIAGRCAVCGDVLAEPLAACVTCETAVHAACGEFLGGCARYACPEAATSRRRMRRYLFERIRHELAVEGFAVLLFAVSAVIVESWIVMLAALLHVPTTLMLIGRIVRLRRDSADPVLIDLLREYPPVVQPSAQPRHGTFVSSLKSGLAIGGAISGGCLITVPFLWAAFGLAEALRLWAMTAAFFVFLALLFGGMFGGAIALFERLIGTRHGKPRWAPLADAWRDEIEDWRRAPSPLLLDSKKPE